MNVLIASVRVLSIGSLHWPSRRGLERRPSSVPVVLTCGKGRKKKTTHHICPFSQEEKDSNSGARTITLTKRLCDATTLGLFRPIHAFSDVWHWKASVPLFLHLGSPGVDFTSQYSPATTSPNETMLSTRTTLIRIN